MTIKYIGDEEYIGLSTDDRTGNFDEGAKLILVDTKETLIYHNNIWYVDEIASASIKSNISTITTTASIITSNQSCSEVLLQSDPDNIADIYIGDADVQCIQLKAGQSISISCSNVKLLYAKTTSGTAQLNWLSRS